MRDIAETSLNRLVTVAYLKKHPNCSVEKGLLKKLQESTCVGVAF